MRTATGDILEAIRPILSLPYRRKVKWKGERLAKEMALRGFKRCKGKEAWRKYFRDDLSVHIICYPHGCYYHVDNH